MAPLDIWNTVQTYTGQSVALMTGDLYILNLCMNKLKDIKE